MRFHIGYRAKLPPVNGDGNGRVTVRLMFLDGGDGSLEMLLVHLGRGQGHMGSVFNLAGELDHKREKKRRSFCILECVSIKPATLESRFALFAFCFVHFTFPPFFEMHMQTTI